MADIGSLPKESGPQTREVQRVLALARCTGGMGPVMCHWSAHLPTDFGATMSIRERAEQLAVGSGHATACAAAHDASYEAACSACGCHAEDIDDGNAFVAGALVVRYRTCRGAGAVRC
ncbi:MAG: hypothetical protein WCH74_01635 [Chloroflexota bacterium]